MKRTPDQQEASRRNGAISIGPTTPSGKARVSTNGVVHGLRSERVVLPHEDPAQYVEHTRIWVESLLPSDEAELELVMAVADIRWRMQRLDAIEMNRTRAEALAQAEDLPEHHFSQMVARVAQATKVMAEVVAHPNLEGEYNLEPLRDAVMTVVEMVRAVEAEKPGCVLGSEALARAMSRVGIRSVDEIESDAYREVVARAEECAAAVAAQVGPAKEAAEKATKALAATVPLPEGKQATLLVRYRRDLERRLQSEMACLTAVRERKVQVAGTSGLLGHPVPIRIVG